MGQMPPAYWAMTYSASRRAHHHRCRCCRKILGEGEAVLMARTAARKTQCLHETCADRVGPDGYSERDYLEAHGMAHLAACGYAEAKQFLARAAISKATGGGQ